MSQEPFLTVYGHVSIDQIISLNEFPQVNTSVDITDKKMHLGGTGCNIAVITAALGVPTAICSYVGSDFPDEFRSFMESKGLIMDELIEVPDLETSTALIVSNIHNDQITYFYQGPMGTMDKDDIMTGMASRSKYVHFSTGNPEYYINVMKALSGKDIKISLDPAQEVHRIWNADSFSRAIALSDTLFSNEYEMSSMLKYLGLDGPEQIPVKTVIRTKGKDGAEIWSDEMHLSVNAIKSDTIVDTTGAGDAFRAGYYAGIYHGYNEKESVSIGSAVASFIIETKGSLTTIPSWEQVMTRVNLIRGE